LTIEWPAFDSDAQYNYVFSDKFLLFKPHHFFVVIFFKVAVASRCDFSELSLVELVLQTGGELQEGLHREPERSLGHIQFLVLKLSGILNLRLLIRVQKKYLSYSG
jgi:hypothetical protein